MFSQINRDKADKGLLIPSGSLWIPLEIKDGHGKSLELELEDHGTSGQLEDVPVPVLSLVAHLMIHFGAY